MALFHGETNTSEETEVFVRPLSQEGSLPCRGKFWRGPQQFRHHESQKWDQHIEGRPLAQPVIKPVRSTSTLALSKAVSSCNLRSLKLFAVITEHPQTFGGRCIGGDTCILAIQGSCPHCVNDA